MEKENYYIDASGDKVELWKHPSYQQAVNMAHQKGYELIGWRPLNTGDIWMDWNGNIHTDNYNSGMTVWIVEPKLPKPPKGKSGVVSEKAPKTSIKEELLAIRQKIFEEHGILIHSVSFGGGDYINVNGNVV